MGSGPSAASHRCCPCDGFIEQSHHAPSSGGALPSGSLHYMHMHMHMHMHTHTHMHMHMHMLLLTCGCDG